MSELKKLFQVKRILAMALAAAMTITSLPATAHAAEPGDSQIAVEAAAEGGAAVNGQADDAQDPATDEGQQTADAQDPVTDEGQQTAAAQDPVTGEGQQTNDVQNPETENAQEPAAQAAELGESVFARQENAEQKAEYKAQDDGTGAYVPVSPVADGTGKKLSASFLSDFSITVNQGKENESSVTLNNTEDPLAATVTWQWFAGDTALGEAKKLTEEGSLPVDAGTYKLRLVLPEKADAYKGATADFEYEITKCPVIVGVDEPEQVAVGTKAKDVRKPQIYEAYANVDDGQVFITVADDPKTEVNEAAKNEVQLNIVVKDAASGVPLGDEDALAKDGEYVISITPEFIGAKKADYEKNYSFIHCDDVKLTIGDLKETRLTLTPDASYNAKQAIATADDRALHIIEAAAFTENLQNLKYTSALEEKDGQDAEGKDKWKAVAVKAEEITGAWYTTASYGGTWTEKDKTYCNLTLGSKMDAAPVNAGVYVYRVSYAGDQKIYAASYADIVVVVDVKEIIVKPVVPDGTKFYDGQSVYDVLSQIDYNLFEADGTTAYEKKDNMWGTSYVPNGKTQPYKPDFKLVEITKDKDGKETGRVEYITKNGENQALKDAVLSKAKEYIVYFSGSKNVYTANGWINSKTDINSRVDSMDPNTCGFKVKDDPETLEANFCTLTVDEKNKAIDVSAIEDAAKAKGKMTQEKVGALDGAFTKIYDGAAIFDLYADYKLAKLKSGDSDPIKNFTYTWERSQYSAEDLLEGVENPDDPNGEKKPVSKEDLETGSWNPVHSVSPSNAGVYRLRVAYKNSRKQGYADPVDIYFVIKKQGIKLGFADKTLVGNEGNNVSDFVNNYMQELAAGTTFTPAKEQPTTAADWKNRDLAEEVSPYYWYRVSWKFQKKVTKSDGAVEWTDAYTLANTTDAYSLVASDVYMRSGDNFDVDTKDVRIPITVKAMGANEIKFDGITTTGGSEITKEKTYDAESVYALIKDDLAKCNTPVIVKTGTDGKETKEAVNLTGAPYGIVYEVYYSGGSEPKIYKNALPTEEADWAWATNAGTYTISASFSGNETYAPLYAELARITVEKKGLILTVPALEEEFEAGQAADDVISAAYTAFMELAEVVKPADGIAGDSLKADMAKWFTVTEKNGSSGFLAWYYDEYEYFSVPYMCVYDTINEETLDSGGILQGAGDQRYRLMIDLYDASSIAECWNNYTITKTDPAQGTPVKVVRGASAVTMNEYGGKKVDVSDEVADPEQVTGSIVKEHTVRILDGISYYNSSNTEGNIVRVQITAPAEYSDYDSIDWNWNKVYYEQAIKNAAKDRLIGTIAAETEENDNDGRHERKLSFMYDATKRDGEEPEDLDFSISWEEGYSEHFVLKFSEAVLLGNLKDAAEPKSLAFNAPPKTMVVGQEEELDVKITKVQNADIICLGYEVTEGKGEIMHVDEFGKVTALKPGRATVEVFPMHLVDGKKERLGTKSVKATITVKDVSAPKVTKVTAKNSDLNVQYTLPNAGDGYRREIYVVKGKNVKADVIKGMVEDMKNEQWEGIFAAAPQFLDYSYEFNYKRIYDYKKKAYTNTVSVWIGGLEPNTDYTVYVRNVSAMRSFADGCKVTLSAVGKAKGAKTAMKSVDEITAQLTENENVKLVEIDDESLEDLELDTPEEIQEEIRDAYEVAYEVPLTAKNAQISLEGLFKDAAGDVAAPEHDYVPLPLAGANLNALRSSFAVPKMAYYFYDYIYEGYDAYYGTPVFEDKGYTKTSNIAAIANNGKVTLKQPGQMTIVAFDTVSGTESNRVTIYVTAEADSMKGKGASMQVGQTIRLENLVEYKQGNVVLNQANYSTYGRIDVKAAQASLAGVDTNECFGISDNGYLTAFGKTNKPLEITLHDKKLNADVKVKISAKDLDAVKGLKAINVIDNRFDVQFEMNPYAEAYRIEVKDAAKKTIRSIYVENIPHAGGEWSNYWTWNDDDWGSNDWESFSDPYHRSEHYVSTSNSRLCRADKEKGKWLLTYRIDRLTQASKYEIEVTTLYGEAFSPKKATKPVSTTKLPVCDNLWTEKDGSVLGLSKISFVSGNTYSINVTGYHEKARIAATDTLTWTVSDKKVVSVKAAPGGYSASLKALKPGTAVIELKSKVLKGVVARRTVTVYAVGDAYNSRDYYGENEDLRGEDTGKPDAVTELKVGVAEPVELSSGQSKKFRVTLTEPGKYIAYKIQRTGGSESIPTSDYIYEGGEYVYEKNSAIPEIKEYTVYGSFTGSIIVKKTGESSSADAFKNRKRISLNEEFKSQYGAWYVFTAPEDGLYGVKSGSATQQKAVCVYQQSADGEVNTTVETSYEYFFELKKNDLVYLQSCSRYSELRLVKATFETLTADSSVTVSANSEKWFVFTPAEKDVYALKYPRSLNCSVYNEEFRKVDPKYRGKDYVGGDYIHSDGYTLDKKVYIQIDSQYSSKNSIVQLIKKNAYQKFGEDGTYTVTNRKFEAGGDELYLTYRVPADGSYTFSYVTTDSNISGYAFLKKVNSNSNLDDVEISGSVGSGQMSAQTLAKDDEVYLKIYDSSHSYPATWSEIKFTVTKDETPTS